MILIIFRDTIVDKNNIQGYLIYEINITFFNHLIKTKTFHLYYRVNNTHDVQYEYITLQLPQEFRKI